MASTKDGGGNGVFLEFFDRAGNCVAQALWLPWKLQTLPAVGDRVRCRARLTADGKLRRVCGVVRERSFDVQLGDDGSPSVWVRIEATLVEQGGTLVRPSRLDAPQVAFSLN